MMIMNPGELIMVEVDHEKIQKMIMKGTLRD